MSAETKARLEAAIREHVADEGGGAYLTDYAVVAASSPPEDGDVTRYIHERSDSPFHTLLGLLEVGREQLLNGDDDE